ncbi:hypothetical protein P9112_000842 [Eukaryota sp. TZLM1-RC]
MLPINDILILIFIGALSSFLSGLLGVGGAGFLLPLLVYGPPILGGENITMNEASALSIGLIWIASLSGSLSIKKVLSSKAIRPLIITLAIPSATFGFLGSIMSAFVHELVLLGSFPILLFFGSIMMLFQPKNDEFDLDDPDSTLDYSNLHCFYCSSGVGFFAGLVGAGGSFLLKPLSIYVLKIPTRVAIAVALPVVFLASTTSLVGKIVSNQMLWEKLLWLVILSIPMAKIGTVVNKKTKAKRLRQLTAWMFIVVSIGMIGDVIYQLIADDYFEF